jgi:hypothetical protein
MFVVYAVNPHIKQNMRCKKKDYKKYHDSYIQITMLEEGRLNCVPSNNKAYEKYASNLIQI